MGDVWTTYIEALRAKLSRLQCLRDGEREAELVRAEIVRAEAAAAARPRRAARPVEPSLFDAVRGGL